jgi:DNA-binding MarR family transcriptional regulator
VTELPQPDEVGTRERGRTTAAELSWALREVQRAQSDVDRRLARLMDLRPTDYQALGHVMTAREPLGPAELSARMGMSTGSGTELVDRLEAAGHLERRPHPGDRRRVVLEPSPATVERILAELAPLLTALDGLADAFTAEEQAGALRYLRSAAGLLTAHAAGPGTAGDDSAPASRPATSRGRARPS